MTEATKLAQEVGARVENWMTNPPRPGLYYMTAEQLDAFVAAIHIGNSDSLYTSQERVQKLEKSNQMLLEALKEIEWSNDSAWQQDRARAAIAQAEKGATP